MSLYNSYLEWQQGIARWPDITEGTVFDSLPDIIRLAEIELAKKLQLREGTRFAKNVIDNDGILTLPDDLNRTKAATLPLDGRILDAVTPDRYFDMVRMSRGSGTVPGGSPAGFAAGFPTVYTIIGNNLQFMPFGGDMEVEIAYYRKAQPLSVSVDTNIYTELAPECLLSAAVMYGMKMLFEEERQAFWVAKMEDDIQTRNAQSQRAELGSSPLVAKPPLRRRLVGYRPGGAL